MNQPTRRAVGPMRDSSSSTEGDSTALAWYVRTFRPEDEPGLLDLYERSYGRPRTPSNLHWKLCSRPAEFPLMWVAARKDDESVVGHYGGIPLRLKLRDRVVPAVHAVEAMTDPAYRRQGMLTALGGAAHDAWRSAGQIAVTGLPNEQWGTRNRALGYRPLFPLAWLRFPLNPHSALERRIHTTNFVLDAMRLPLRIAAALWRARLNRLASSSRLARRLTIVSSTEDPARFDEMWGEVSSRWSYAVVRDSGWVPWRYLEAEPQKYCVLVAQECSGRPVGYIAFRLVTTGERRTGYIADLVVGRGDRACAAKLIAAALNVLHTQGAGSVMTLAPPRSVTARYFRWLGFLPTAGSTAFTFEVVPLDSTLDLATLSEPADWLLSGGDFDVI
jgi:hypothetical protein